MLQTKLDAVPRVRLAHLPTPLEPLPALSAHLGGPRILMKRDDCTGLATGGNKARKLEYLMADAQAQAADVVLTAGALQTNHGRQTAAAAARLGMACELVLTDAVPDRSPAYHHSGNLLLDHLLGATVHRLPSGSDGGAFMAKRAEALRSEGLVPYVIPVGGSNALGALGYANAALELLAQAARQGEALHHLVHATGSSGTQAGLLAGLIGAGADLPVLGVCVSRTAEVQARNVAALLQDTLALLDLPDDGAEGRVHCDGDHVGPGYGQPTDAMAEAVGLCAQLEGVLLDPVYSGKAMAGLIAAIRQGRYGRDETVCFLHTGGAAGLFAYEAELGPPA